MSGSLEEENARLKAELAELHRQRENERAELAAKLESEKGSGKQFAEVVGQRTAELDAMKHNVMKLTRQLDEEVSRRDRVFSESQALERKLQDLTMGVVGSLAGPSTGSTAAGGGASAVLSISGRSRSKGGASVEEQDRERNSQVSTKLMRVIDQWMRQRDMQHALLRGAGVNDQAFSTLVQALSDCPSLQTLDLSQNLLTMDSCSDLCNLVTSASQLSFVSLADNLLSLRSIGYFMTAVMERQSTKRLMPLDLLDLSGNEGLVAAAQAPPPDALMRQVHGSLRATQTKLPPMGAELVAQVMRALWRFLHDTGHPQVRVTQADEIAFHVLDKVTLRKMENALMKMMLLSAEGATSTISGELRPVTANLALLSALDGGLDSLVSGEAPGDDPVSPPATAAAAAFASTTPAPKSSAFAAPRSGGSRELPPLKDEPGGGGGGKRLSASASAPMLPKTDVRDPFADLKLAFEPPREKLKTFNLKQCVTGQGAVLIHMLERMLETTEIDAIDVETDQTLLEYACNTGNMSLAKLCYRRGAKLAARTKKGDTAFNIVTRNRRYDIMEFLHTYGVKVNSCDANGLTALHVAAKNDDVDSVCRLVEWGADVNIRDKNMCTPIHLAAAAGNAKATMLLLELGADMNAKDGKLYTAAAHANFNSHFDLFDRLVKLGGRRHGQITDKERVTTQRGVGQIPVSAGVLKSSSLGRIGKIRVAGMPGPLAPVPISELGR